MRKLTILGLGYIGLPTAAIVANANIKVLGIDIQGSVVDTVNAGEIHIEEPGLEQAVSSAVSSGYLRASLKPEAADIFMIAVPTPFIEENKKPDMSFVRSAAKSISPVLEKGNLVILQSTSPVHATEKDVKAVIEEARPDLIGELDYVYCPERAIPGKTMQELVENDRPIGGLDAQATKRGIEFYKNFVTGNLLETTAATAEMVKLVENASRDVQIAFANELANVCEKMDLNVWNVIKLANLHPRVDILRPGPGVGGHCLAVDPWFIINEAKEETALMQAARATNDGRPDMVVQQVVAYLGKTEKPTVTLLGLAYKENVDDFRQSPAIDVAKKLKEKLNGDILVVEPFMKESQDYNLVSLDDGLKQADVVIVLTAHDAFKEITLKQLEGKKLFDTRGIFSK